jgi:hypothetical protein
MHGVDRVGLASRLRQSRFSNSDKAGRRLAAVSNEGHLRPVRSFAV